MNNEIRHEPATQSQGVTYSPQYSEDEINLLDIWRVLVSQWKLIVGITVIVSLLAVGYALYLPRVYKAEVFILPPSGKDVLELNRLASERLPVDIERATVGTVYEEMTVNLQSRALRRKFFDQHQLAEKIDPTQSELSEVENIFTKEFYELLSIQKGKKDNANFYTISLEGRQPELIKAWLNDFVLMVHSYTINAFAEKIEAAVANKKKAINKQIEGLRNVALKQRLDQIMRLQEQLQIAEKLGIVKRNTGTGFPPTLQSFTKMELSINSFEAPVYLRGTETLQAEIGILQKRKNDDAFIKNFRNLQDGLALLGTFHLNRDKIRAMRIDRLAIQPENPIKPKRKMIVVVGTMLGLMLGVLTAFLVNFIATSRREGDVVD